MNERLKNIIFYKLYEDLKDVETIPYKNSIWFIDRKEKYWYFVYHKKNNHLWWKHSYFRNYFALFSLEEDESEFVMSRWVEEVLNSRVDTTMETVYPDGRRVEEVLNSRVGTTFRMRNSHWRRVEEVLNSRVDTTEIWDGPYKGDVEEVLNSRVGTTTTTNALLISEVEEVLNSTNHE